MAESTPKNTEQWGVRLPGELLGRWKALAASRGMTPAKWQVYVMKQVLDGEGSHVGLPLPSAEAKTGRLHIKLRPDELALVRKAAATEGYTLAGWVAALIRARLKQAPYLVRDELDALHALSNQLRAVGRNINTAVRRLHAEGKWSPRDQPMKRVLALVEDVQERLGNLQETATRRGRI